jgi:hypothetical protein
MLGIFFIDGPTTAGMGALSVVMQQCCFQLYGKQSGHKNTQLIKQFHLFSGHFLHIILFFLNNFHFYFPSCRRNKFPLSISPMHV